MLCVQVWQGAWPTCPRCRHATSCCWGHRSARCPDSPPPLSCPTLASSTTATLCRNYHLWVLRLTPVCIGKHLCIQVCTCVYRLPPVYTEVHTCVYRWPIVCTELTICVYRSYNLWVHITSCVYRSYHLWVHVAICGCTLLLVCVCCLLVGVCIFRQSLEANRSQNLQQKHVSEDKQ